jgi:hypothetical protein
LRWFPAGVAESQWLAAVVLAAAAGAVLLTMVAGPGVLQKGGGRSSSCWPAFRSLCCGAGCCRCSGW